MEIRIGIDARLVYYRQAGIGQYILRLTEALAKIDQENEFVLLQSRKHKQAIVDQPNFRRASLCRSRWRWRCIEGVGRSESL